MEDQDTEEVNPEDVFVDGTNMEREALLEDNEIGETCDDTDTNKSLFEMTIEEIESSIKEELSDLQNDLELQTDSGDDLELQMDSGVDLDSTEQSEREQQSDRDLTVILQVENQIEENNVITSRLHHVTDTAQLRYVLIERKQNYEALTSLNIQTGEALREREQISNSRCVNFGRCILETSSECDNKQLLLLPCLHAVCKPCLDQQEPETMPCRCDQQMKYDKTKLLADFVNHNETLLAKAKIQCGFLNEPCSNMVVSYCTNCKVSMCSDCQEDHRRIRMMSSHEIIPIDNVDKCPPEKRLTPTTCPNHPQQNLLYVDKRCDRAICHLCLTGDHEGHDIKALKSEYSKRIEDLTNSVGTYENRLRDIQEKLKDRYNRLSELQLSHDQLGRQIVETHENVTAKFLHRLKDLLQKTNDEFTVLQNNVREDIQNITATEATFLTTMTYANRCMESTTQAEFLELFDVMSRKISRDLSHPVPEDSTIGKHVVFSNVGQKALEQLVDAFGDVRLSDSPVAIVDGTPTPLDPNIANVSGDILNKTFYELKQQLKPDEVLAHMLSEGVFTQSEIDRCRELTGRQAQCGELLNILKCKGEDGYKHFCIILEKTQGHLKRMLDDIAKTGESTQCKYVSESCMMQAIAEKDVIISAKEKELMKKEEEFKSHSADFEKQIESLQVNHTEKVSQLKDEHAAIVERLEKEKDKLQLELNQEQERKQAESTQCKYVGESCMMQAIAEKDMIISAKEKELMKKEEEFKSHSADFEKQIESLQVNHTEKVSQLKDEHAATVERLEKEKDKLQLELNQEQERKQAESTQCKYVSESCMMRAIAGKDVIISATEKELVEKEAEFKSHSADYEKQIESLQVNHTEKVSQLKDEHAARVERLEKEKDKLQTELIHEQERNLAESTQCKYVSESCMMQAIAEKDVIISAKEKDLMEKEAEFKSHSADYEKQIENLQVSHTEKVSQLKDEHAATVERVEKKKDKLQLELSKEQERKIAVEERLDERGVISDLKQDDTHLGDSLATLEAKNDAYTSLRIEKQTEREGPASESLQVQEECEILHGDAKKLTDQLKVKEEKIERITLAKKEIKSRHVDAEQIIYDLQSSLGNIGLDPEVTQYPLMTTSVKMSHILQYVHLQFDRTRVNLHKTHINKDEHLVNSPETRHYMVSDSAFQHFSGTSSTVSIHKAGGPQYLEVLGVIGIDRRLFKNVLLLNIGLCREKDIDVAHYIPARQHCYSLEVGMCSKHCCVCTLIWKDGKTVRHLSDTVQNIEGSETNLHYGIVCDDVNGKIGFIDVKNNEVLSVLENVNFDHALWPMFGLFQLYGLTTEMKVVGGESFQMTTEKKALILKVLQNGLEK